MRPSPAVGGRLKTLDTKKTYAGNLGIRYFLITFSREVSWPLIIFNMVLTVVKTKIGQDPLINTLLSPNGTVIGTDGTLFELLNLVLSLTTLQGILGHPLYTKFSTVP